MPIFRPGKPYLVASRATDYMAPIGLHRVPFDVAEADPAGFWTGEEYTVPTSGQYLIVGGVGRLVVPTASILSARLEVNNVGVAQETITQGLNGLSASLVAYKRLTAGDVVHLEAVAHTLLGVVIPGILCHLSIVRLGPVKWT